MFEIPTRKQQWRHLLSSLESPRSNREKERTEWSVQQLHQTGMASQLHPPTNGKAESQQGPREPLLPPCPPAPLHLSGPFFPCSQPASRQLQRIAPLSQTHLLAAARGERFSSFFCALQWWWWPAVQQLSPPAGWLPTSPRDGCHRTRAPEQLSHPSVPLPTGYSDAERRGVPKQIAAAGWWCSRSSGPVGLFDCSERRDRPGKAGKTRVFGVHTCCVVIIVEGRTHHPPPGSPEDAGGDWTY